MAAEQTDVLVSIHSIVMCALEQLGILVLLILLLGEVEMISQFDTCVKVSKLVSISSKNPYTAGVES